MPRVHGQLPERGNPVDPASILDKVYQEGGTTYADLNWSNVAGTGLSPTEARNRLLGIDPILNAKYPGGAQQIIWAAGPIAIEYKVAGVSNLKLSPSTLASIFAGKIKTWNDPAIAADNPGTNLPSEGIQVVHRSDGSGTTAAFTGYLTTVAGTVWTVGSAKDVPWPTGQGAKGSDGVTAVVTQTPNAWRWLSSPA